MFSDRYRLLMKSSQYGLWIEKETKLNYLNTDRSRRKNEPFAWRPDTTRTLMSDGHCARSPHIDRRIFICKLGKSTYNLLINCEEEVPSVRERLTEDAW